jgi:MSHA biogenesis protein MshO
MTSLGPPGLARGVSLIEMVIAFAILAIIGSTIGGVIYQAARSYDAQKRRAALVDAADGALRRMSRDIRLALPNSLRVTDSGTGASFALELIPTADGGRYCVTGVADCDTPAEVLDFTAADTIFEILGCFRNAAFVAAATAGTTAYRLVINNSGSEVYTASGSPAVITPTGTSLTLSVSPPTGACGSSNRRHQVTIGGTGHQFSSSSSRHRVFVVESAAAPVSYLCDASAGTLRRYAGYTFQAAQPTTHAALSALTTNIGLVAENLSECRLKTDASQVQQEGLATLALSVSSGEGDRRETVRLVQQVQLDNSQ